MRLFVSAGAIAVALGISAPALADGTFGGPGQLAVSGDMQFTVQGQSFSAPSGQIAPGSTTTVTLAPAADFFVVEGLSVGGQFIYAHASQTSGVPGTTNFSEDGFGIAPRVGYNFALGDTFSIWPKVFLEYETTTISNGGGSASELSVGMYVPVLVHPAKHFFLGLGPNVQTELSTTGGNGTKETQYGVMFVVGGWVPLAG
jgi:hypothetical protein